MRSKGFTLTELLAVIVVLSVIALIATPIIINVIEKAKIGALVSSVNGLVESANMYYTNEIIKGDIIEDVVFEFVEGIQTGTNKLSYKGKVYNGKLILTNDSEVTTCIDDGKYYAYKEKNSDEVISGIGTCLYDGTTGDFTIESDVDVIQKECENERLELQEKINTLTNNVNELKTTINEKEYEISNLKATIDNLNNELIVLTGEKEELLKQIENSNLSNNELQEKINELNGTIATLESSLEAKNNEITTLNGEKQELINQLATLNANHKELQSKIDILNKELENNELIINEKEKTINDLISSKEGLENQITTLIGEKEELIKQIETCKANLEKPQEDILNGADPVLTGNLIPITLSKDGTVTYADTNSKWYSYENKEWANAVILVDSPSKTYVVGETILESDIESYFVWIPRFRYKLWNTGTAIKNAHEIEIVFENKNTAVSTGSANGEWLTHPAFTSFDVNGIWVGKFETGYNGATSTSSSGVNSSDSSKIIIKPNVYSWRNITVGNIFTVSYNYERDLDSHMMKNTEWGAVAYLSHSAYGINSEVNINNNSSYKTGYSALPSTNQQTYLGTYGDGDSYNKPYNTEIGYLASTTGNITGVYDMSGGAQEYVAGYISGNVGSSGLTVANYDSKYFDVYSASSTITSYQYRILGDATGEMGPFKQYLDGDNSSRYHSSWYADNSNFAQSSGSWFDRGGNYTYGVLSGAFCFNRLTGGTYTHIGFRLVLAI